MKSLWLCEISRSPLANFLIAQVTHSATQASSLARRRVRTSGYWEDPEDVPVATACPSQTQCTVFAFASVAVGFLWRAGRRAEYDHGFIYDSIAEIFSRYEVSLRLRLKLEAEMERWHSLWSAKGGGRRRVVLSGAPKYGDDLVRFAGAAAPGCYAVERV